MKELISAEGQTATTELQGAALTAFLRQYDAGRRMSQSALPSSSSC
ncbi:hypothetical protein AB4099_29405 [Bosea sp. 2KB_26]